LWQKIRAALADKSNAGETLIQLLLIDNTPAASRIIEKSFRPRKPFQYHEMVEVPMKNHWWLELTQVAGLSFKSAHL
jgi:hypothetical protein